MGPSEGACPDSGFEPGPLGFPGTVLLTAPSLWWYPWPAFSTKYPVAACRTRAFERCCVLHSAHCLFRSCFPIYTEGNDQKWHFQATRQMASQEADKAFTSGSLVSSAGPRGGRDLFPSHSCRTLPVRGLGVPGLVSGRQLATAPNGTSCLELSTPPSAGLSPSSPRIPCLGLTTVTEQRV